MAKFVFYHATPAEKVHSIMEKGIKGEVYLTRFPKQAESFPCQAARELHKGINEWAVLKLSFDNFPWKLSPDSKWGELGVYKAENVDIDPKHITLYKRLDLSESYQCFKELYLNTNPVVEYDRQYSLEELREMASQAGLSPSGSKKEIAARLIAEGIR